MALLKEERVDLTLLLVIANEEKQYEVAILIKVKNKKVLFFYNIFFTCPDFMNTL